MTTGLDCSVIEWNSLDQTRATVFCVNPRLVWATECSEDIPKGRQERSTKARVTSRSQGRRGCCRRSRRTASSRSSTCSAWRRSAASRCGRCSSPPPSPRLACSSRVSTTSRPSSPCEWRAWSRRGATWRRPRSCLVQGVGKDWRQKSFMLVGWLRESLETKDLHEWRSLSRIFGECRQKQHLYSRNSHWTLCKRLILTIWVSIAAQSWPK